MQKIEVVNKDIRQPRLTVTKDRITIKLPLNCDKKEWFKEKFLKAAEQIGKPQHSLRSSVLQEKFLAMRDNKGNVLFRFNLEEL
jgi:hypothetical protein